MTIDDLNILKENMAKELSMLECDLGDIENNHLTMHEIFSTVDDVVCDVLAHFRNSKLVKQSDSVNHPPHYNMGGVEVIDAIEAWQLGFNLGNAVKYIARAGKKDASKTVEDLRKAEFYLRREIDRMQKNSSAAPSEA